ncbi:MAG: LexA family transcriptional regulator [Desulfovibrio sp.]
MPRDWSQGYEIIYKKYLSTEHAKEFGRTKIGLARCLGLTQGKTQKWEKGQWPSADDLAVIAEKLECDYRWLVTGEGDPFSPQPHQRLRPPARPVPVLGLASCGVEGWQQVMPIASSATLLVTESMVAVIAAGESMVPAGIAPGHICYCDPDQQVLAGDAVYVRRRDGLATIKVFLGVSHELGPDYVRFKGWLPAVGPVRKEFFIDTLAQEIETIAPIIFVRRRI